MRNPSTSLRGGLMLAAVLTLAACGSAPDEPARRARPALETLTVESSVASNARVWDGVVSAERESLLSSQTAGRVTDVAVDIGDRVTRGQSLLSISAVEQQAGVNAAVAQVKAADAALAEAELAFKRAAELVERGLVARAQLDQATAARDSSRAARDAARAQLAQARQQTGYTDVVAPFDGVVSLRQVMPGEAVAPGSPLLTVVDPASLRVDATLPQGLADAIGDGGNVRVVLPDGSERAPARLITYPVADARSHSITVRALLPADVAGVMPGQVLGLRIPEATNAGTTADTTTIRIPDSAVYRRGELTAVYVVGKDTIALRQLRLGAASGGQVDVLSGLRAGEQIAGDPLAAMTALKAQRQASEQSHD
ncbi:MAG: efflux RND transporter periplasmic adaptor subunit [Lysobacteraceae bacterium]|nr:efflux RND transporter periplasmic adaptor subunit [Xanthomonadaceae bacterium]